MKTREQYKKWLQKNIEGWSKPDNKSINVILKSGKCENVELLFFDEANKDKFTKEELSIALLNKKY